MKTFNYKKSKVIEAAATHQQRNIYNFLKTFGCPRSLDVEIELCAKNQWLDEYYSFFRSCRYVAIGGTHEDKLRILRQMMYSAIKYGDITMMRSALGYYPSTVRDAFANIGDMHNIIEETIKTEHVQKIELIYNTFCHKYRDWSPSDFEDAIATGNMNTLKCVIEAWRESPGGLRGVGNQMKLATIKHNRLVMLQYLDRFIPGYPEHMLHEMRRTRGHSTQARREMIAYVREEQRRARRRSTASLAAGIVERERIEQRQATAAPVAPAEERPTNLQKALAIIEDCDIQEGKYLELCNLLMDVHRRGVRA
jgi:hypothetical protein